MYEAPIKLNAVTHLMDELKNLIHDLSYLSQHYAQSSIEMQCQQNALNLLDDVNLQLSNSNAITLLSILQHSYLTD